MRFFLRMPPKRLQGTQDCRDTASDVQMTARFFKSGIGLLPGEFPNLVKLSEIESRKSATGMVLGFNGAGLSAALSQPHNEE
jgi:hypothetical protein